MEPRGRAPAEVGPGEVWKEALSGQLGAAVDTLEHAVAACPDELWSDRSRRPEFWYLVFHTLFFLDYYLSESPAGFRPPGPFTLDELDPAGISPPRVYTRNELRKYLEHGRRKARLRIEGLTDADASSPCGFERRDMTVLELLLYTLRHVQHHAAQLNLLLRQETDSSPPWVTRAGDELREDPPP